MPSIITLQKIFLIMWVVTGFPYMDCATRSLRGWWVIKSFLGRSSEPLFVVYGSPPWLKGSLRKVKSIWFTVEFLSRNSGGHP